MFDRIVGAASADAAAALFADLGDEDLADVTGPMYLALRGAGFHEVAEGFADAGSPKAKADHLRKLDGGWQSVRLGLRTSSHLFAATPRRESVQSRSGGVVYGDDGISVRGDVLSSSSINREHLVLEPLQGSALQDEQAIHYKMGSDLAEFFKILWLSAGNSKRAPLSQNELRSVQLFFKMVQANLANLLDASDFRRGFFEDPFMKRFFSPALQHRNLGHAIDELGRILILLQWMKGSDVNFVEYFASDLQSFSAKAFMSVLAEEISGVLRLSRLTEEEEMHLEQILKVYQTVLAKAPSYFPQEVEAFQARVDRAVEKRGTEKRVRARLARVPIEEINV